MDWITSLFSSHSSIQADIVISLVIAIGLALGRVKVMGISLGIAFVFFVGIIAGHFGLSVSSQTLDYVETFGLSMFVYCLGLHVGPNFFGSMRHEGMALNLWSLAVIVLGTLIALVLIPLPGVSLPNMVGLLCGATTNTPALGAATQALSHLGLASGSAALATAVTYPLGVVGVIFAMVLIRKAFVKPEDLQTHSLGDDDHTYIAQLTAINPAVAGKTIAQIAQMTHLHFIVSRIWRGKEVIVPLADTSSRSTTRCSSSLPPRTRKPSCCSSDSRRRKTGTASRSTGTPSTPTSRAVSAW
jgi:AspT/YidE/YbjL antiporter-like protein